MIFSGLRPIVKYSPSSGKASPPRIDDVTRNSGMNRPTPR
jgi:hypothetical protein